MSLQKEHHLWCKDYDKATRNCGECRRLFKQYPDVRWDNVHEKANQYFPNGGINGRTQQIRKD